SETAKKLSDNAPLLGFRVTGVTFSEPARPIYSLKAEPEFNLVANKVLIQPISHAPVAAVDDRGGADTQGVVFMANGVVRRLVERYVHIYRIGLPQQRQVSGYNAGAVARPFKASDHEGNVLVLPCVEEILVAQVIISFVVIGEHTFSFKSELPGRQFSGFLVIDELTFDLAEHAHHWRVANVHDLKAHGEVFVINCEGCGLRQSHR